VCYEANSIPSVIANATTQEVFDYSRIFARPSPLGLDPGWCLILVLQKGKKMEPMQLKTNSVQELTQFGKSNVSSLVRFRMETIKGRDGAFVTELVTPADSPSNNYCLYLFVP
jgi:hypothetical protein